MKWRKDWNVIDMQLHRRNVIKQNRKIIKEEEEVLSATVEESLLQQEN